ncbi:FxSxx-COOH system tetratricopeptide repeat protein [Streptomyces litchfieldiae]|uniref:FxSxx-COOH system tetratricopeptide repeat protein n=1 Tax=Streptomyces litchfieldiae TaxID=3075543 RepID=A0ABU2MQT6_9ACTN|nr:FxSxx-COOH system tetratricopeptide repeat protein [Streptomyces sp. DSM 44938]MDT0343875.1 FxSxx-COOH system tetratricopeptide repeat protein [Streptomyces sp. DSM 44938]
MTEPSVSLRPLVRWPREVEPGRSYLITVDLELAGPAGEWPYDREEYAVGCVLESRPGIAIESLGAAAVLLHRFGGTYGPARFVAHVTAEGAPRGAGELSLTLVTAGGVPFRTMALPVSVTPGNGSAPPDSGQARLLLPDTGRAADGGPAAPAPPSPGRAEAGLGPGPAEAEPGPGFGPGPAVDGPSPPGFIRRLPRLLRRRRPAGEPPREPETPPQDREERQITISFAGFNRAWAAWIGHRLELAGLRVTHQRWNPPMEIPLEEALRDLLLVEGRILVVLSDWYFKLGPRTDAEWNAALRSVVAPNSHRFAAVSVASMPMPTAAAAFGEVTELWGMGTREAERRLLTVLGLDRASSSDAVGGPRFPHDQPEVWGGVPRRNARFTGREYTLQAVYETLQQAEPGAGVVTLLGMSGVGKTQIAAEYVHRFGSEYDMVWWVPAEQRGTLRQRLAELAPALGLTTGPEYGERLRAVANVLRRGDPYSRWLVVLDGADDPAPIADLVPSGPGHVIITSQNREWAEYNTALHEVPLYDRDESVAFIRRRAPRIGYAEADALAEALGDLPLALDQTAGWLSDSSMSVAEYIDLLGSGSDQEIGLRVAADFPMTYYTAFAILLNRLRETVPEAVELLRLCAFFAPGTIPVQLIRAVPAEDLPGGLALFMTDALRWNAAISKLVQYSVIRWDASDTEADPESSGTIHVHRMVHQIVRVGMARQDWDLFARAVRRGLSAANPGRPSDTRRWSRFAKIVPHLDASGALASRNADMHRLIFHCLSYLYLAGEYTTGIQLAERAERAWRDVFGEDDPLVWDLASQKATLLRATGAYRETEAIDREVIERLGVHRGPRDLTVLRAEEGLGADLSGQARYTESLEISQRVFDTYQELVGEHDPRTLNARHNLAASLRFLGRFEEALEADRFNLQERRELHRPRHTLSLSSENAFGLDLRLLGRYAEALSVMEQSVETHRLVMGPDNPQTLTAELNLAMCLRDTSGPSAALARLGPLLERTERVLGDFSPLTLAAATCCATAERAHGELDRARWLGERVVETYRATLGHQHPFTIGATMNHALVLRATGERPQSLLLLEECLAGMTNALGPDHPWTLGVALNTSAGRDPRDAAPLSRDTTRRATAVLGRTHPVSLSAQVGLAADLRAVRQFPEANQVEEQALMDLVAMLGHEHARVIEARTRVRPQWDFEPLVG